MNDMQQQLNTRRESLAVLKTRAQEKYIILENQQSMNAYMESAKLENEALIARRLKALYGVQSELLAERLAALLLYEAHLNTAENSAKLEVLDKIEKFIAQKRSSRLTTMESDSELDT